MCNITTIADAAIFVRGALSGTISPQICCPWAQHAGIWFGQVSVGQAAQPPSPLLSPKPDDAITRRHVATISGTPQLKKIEKEHQEHS
ncbi:uncharacterized protein CLAFUR5_05314 [Fulvia fulva]|uniref:Uncharacterized protein n=1 Tax=Passalora fulva TaxID=5499 RepID=A0A9Q8LEI6_PASFU|nr:uncharacterized protein CLAFUR5_05314 [Fulvia fulva]KAK4616616.1 hypothetical protein CLAFUR0_10711 [Fulvia fulva]UJO15940.1 hypothetical protein CLAFUR5_05314 [Fulvia fulva]